MGALHTVSVWATGLGLTLGQVATDGKSNEITAIPELLRLVDVSGAIVTIDAMGTQTAIARQIIDGGDYLLALKGNQEGLHQGAIDDTNGQAGTGVSPPRTVYIHRGNDPGAVQGSPRTL